MAKNFLQLAQRLASDVGRADDADTIAKAKEFVADRYRDIWDRAPWKGALATVRKASTYPYNLLALPYACDRLMGVRCGRRELQQTPLDIVMMGGYERFTETGDPSEYVQLAPALWTSPTYPSGISTLRVTGDGLSPVKVTWTATNGEQYASTVTPPSGSYLNVASNVVSLDHVSQDSAADVVFADSEGPIYYVYSTYPNPIPLQRILFTTTPSAAETYTLLFKRKCIELVADSDIPALNGVERTLLDYAHADMLEWIRQVAKAEIKRAEAEKSFELLRRSECWQEQTLRRVIPMEPGPSCREVVDSGYGLGWPKNP